MTASHHISILTFSIHYDRDSNKRIWSRRLTTPRLSTLDLLHSSRLTGGEQLVDVKLGLPAFGFFLPRVMETDTPLKDHTTENSRKLDTTFTRLTGLLNWCSENNIELDPRIQLVDDHKFGICVFSKDVPIPALETRKCLMSIITIRQGLSRKTATKSTNLLFYLLPSWAFNQKGKWSEKGYERVGKRCDSHIQSRARKRRSISFFSMTGILYVLCGVNRFFFSQSSRSPRPPSCPHVLHHSSTWSPTSR